VPQLLAAFDKFFNLLAAWPAYLSPIAAQILPLPSSFMHVIGGIETLVGLVILAGYTRVGPVCGGDLARQNRGKPSDDGALLRHRNPRFNRGHRRIHAGSPDGSARK